jgi:hypothetical protein
MPSKRPPAVLFTSTLGSLPITTLLHAARKEQVVHKFCSAG